MIRSETTRGSVLIFTLWVLSLLAIFSVHIGLKIRQRVNILLRMEERSQLHYLAEAGLLKSIAVLRKNFEKDDGAYSVYGKSCYHNNPGRFARIPLGNGSCSIHYTAYQDVFLNPETRYGIIDEESKININFAKRDVLSRLIFRTALNDQKSAERLADAIIAWREQGETRLTGFHSDEYYKNLEYPYSSKNEFFEVIDELKLIQGASLDVYRKLKPFITIYGDGLVNINTANREVLLALGLAEEVADKLLSVRRGADGKDATADDYVFRKTYDIASEMKKNLELKEPEVKQIDRLNVEGLIKTNAFLYLVSGTARLKERGMQLSFESVYNLANQQVLYFRERYENF